MRCIIIMRWIVVSPRVHKCVAWACMFVWRLELIRVTFHFQTNLVAIDGYRCGSKPISKHNLNGCYCHFTITFVFNLLRYTFKSWCQIIALFKHDFYILHAFFTLHHVGSLSMPNFYNGVWYCLFWPKSICSRLKDLIPIKYSKTSEELRKKVVLGPSTITFFWIRSYTLFG